VAKLKEHHIMCAEELARNQSIRQVASTFGVDESTLRYRLYRHKEGSVDGRSLQQEACAPYEPVILERIRQQVSIYTQIPAVNLHPLSRRRTHSLLNALG